MAYKEMFFVQTFEVNAELKMRAGRSYECDDAEHAKRRAKYLAEKAHGVIAFSQMVEPKTGDSEEPTLLASYGCVPREVTDSIVRYEGVTDLAQARVA